MKKLVLSMAFAAFVSFYAQAQEYKIITTVESIVPMGIGRSRMIDPQATADYKGLTTARTDGKKSSQGDVKRDEVKIDNFEETRLLNIYSAVGINSHDIASNDAVRASRLTERADERRTRWFV